MIPYRVIQHKRDGRELEPADIASFFRGYMNGTVADYQMSAFLMAVHFRGLSGRELSALVEVMIASGTVLDLSGIPGPKVDKHSTGGVGDKVSLVLAPLAAALGIRVPMMSGHGLGHTGGTLDKLEAISGFRTDLDLRAVQRQLRSIGCAMLAATREIAPLDSRLYALRDVTGTVESIPLIASSIMSKKLAEGIDGLVLDVKRGGGSFLPELDRALELARTMVGIAETYGREVVALVTAMDRPLGRAVGNALETREALEALHGGGPEDLRELTVALAVEMLRLGGVEPEPTRAAASASAALDDGRALEVFRRVVEAQGGDPRVVDEPERLPGAPEIRRVSSERGGWIVEVDARAVGEAAVALGAGRRSLSDHIHPGVGFLVDARPGSRVERGALLGTVFAVTREAAREGERSLRAAIRLGDEPGPPPLPLVSHRVDSSGVQPLAED